MEVKSQLAELEFTKPKNNLPPTERKALEALKHDTEINFIKADKGTTTVLMSTQDKVKEGQIQVDNEKHYKTLASTMVVDTRLKVQQLINDLYMANT